jgi:hypothetical protein
VQRKQKGNENTVRRLVHLLATILDLTHHHPAPGCPATVALAGLGSAGVMSELGVQDLLLDRAPSPASARMAYTSGSIFYVFMKFR